MAQVEQDKIITDNTASMVFSDHPPILRKDISDTEWTDTKAVLITFMSIINVFMFLGNTLSIVAICYTKKLRQQVSYWFVLNLAVIDLIISVTVVPINTVWEYSGTWPFSRTTCEFFTFADISFSTISAYSIVLVSIDKYVYITYSIHYYDKMTRKIALLLIAGVWIMVFIFAMVSILTKVGTDDYFEDHFLVLPNNTNICIFVMTDAYVLPSAVFSFFIPFLILCFTSSRITCIASKHIKKIHTITISITETDSESTRTIDKARPRRHTVIGGSDSNPPVKTTSFRKVSSEKDIFSTKQKNLAPMQGNTNLCASIKETTEVNEAKTSHQSGISEIEQTQDRMKTEATDINKTDRKISQPLGSTEPKHVKESTTNVNTDFNGTKNLEQSDNPELKNMGESNETSNEAKITYAKFKEHTDNTGGSDSRFNNQGKDKKTLAESDPDDKQQNLDIPATRGRSESMRSYKLRQSDSIKSVLRKTSPYCKLFGTVTIVIACFILMFAPYNIATVIDVPCHCIEPWVYEDVLAVLYYMHSLVNPYIYMATDRKYKAALKILWKTVITKLSCTFFRM
ncbi:alpha-2B adrenergic receptor-like [Mercenaria mercenaria]|uniref:alpha-2B adrenergic receptor-like n=1 Tax=Mercenaria mercenaria TaxID=6596 RepID=UPI00234E3A80|nr:alpha-2B adrenergic receptor-like [Mercenaria mercenaria]XP_053387924.1 alpha-2B adrenergic receptor-like [Mercenaria mercenaria]